MKVYAQEAMLESIKQIKQQVTILMSEQGTQQVDGPKVVSQLNKYGRAVGFGMDGNKLKITLNIKGLDQEKWLSVAYEIIKEVNSSLKTKEHVI